MNRWNIPGWLEREVLERDGRCVYCGTAFGMSSASPRHRTSWEHIINEAKLISPENIARCCIGCNASKGAKPLAGWLESKYCRVRGITRATVASIVRAALEVTPSQESASTHGPTNIPRQDEQARGSKTTPRR
jgi:hypothetical protein